MLLMMCTYSSLEDGLMCRRTRIRGRIRATKARTRTKGKDRGRMSSSTVDKGRPLFKHRA